MPSERTDREEAVAPLAGREHMPVVAVEAGDAHVRHEHRVRVDGLAGHADAQRAAHGRAAAVGRDGVPRADRVSGGEVRGHRVRVLFDRHQLAAELHPPAEFREPLEQDLLRAPLRHHPRVGVRGVVTRLRRVEHPVLADPCAVLPDHADGIGATHGVDRVQHAEVVEDLPRARLDPLAA